MNTHRFILEPYKDIGTRNTCPAYHRKRSFSRYIDTEKKITFPDYVGRCDREQKCGYHLTPREFFERNPMEKEKLTNEQSFMQQPMMEMRTIKANSISYIDTGIVYQSSEEQAVSVPDLTVRRSRCHEVDEEVSCRFFQTLGRGYGILAD